MFPGFHQMFSEGLTAKTGGFRRRFYHIRDETLPEKVQILTHVLHEGGLIRIYYKFMDLEGNTIRRAMH